MVAMMMMMMHMVMMTDQNDNICKGQPVIFTGLVPNGAPDDPIGGRVYKSCLRRGRHFAVLQLIH